ncbi:enoyl-CoA hydratase-related protein [Candidatus Poriferisocius sp.]|uniref:enoyl-CoA hydratase-related protein n=1 Tax=Candidatus Poriferisocius sp. TaxID=3101276 RepID=UPI003B028973
MPDVRVEQRDHVAIVTLDRPPVNAANDDTFVEIREVFAAFGDDRDVRVAIFTGAGERAFCAGVDLSPPNSAPRSERHPRELIDAGYLARESMWAIIDCTVPVIGAINGYALGVGLAYAACCDMLVASENATFGTPEINVGLLGASAHLSLMMGRHKAREMFLTGEQVSAQEMYRIGAVREVTAPDKLMDTALELACELATKSPIAMRLAKESMNRIEHLPLREGYRTEQDYTTRLMRFDDSREARRAFREKRDPEYKWE